MIRSRWVSRITTALTTIGTTHVHPGSASSKASARIARSSGQIGTIRTAWSPPWCSVFLLRQYRKAAPLPVDGVPYQRDDLRRAPQPGHA